MHLYLIRHGIAVDPDPTALDSIASDASRSLTKVGRKKMIQVADRLRTSGLKFDLMITSPLVRARQTADILIDNQLSPKIEIDPHLAPTGNLQTWLTEWTSRGDLDSIKTLALVGHEPNLSEWAELLIFGQIYHQLILKKGGMIGLKFPTDRIQIGMAQLYCLIPPKYR